MRYDCSSNSPKKPQEIRDNCCLNNKMRNNSQRAKKTLFGREYSFNFFFHGSSESQLQRSVIQIELKKHPNKNKCCWKWIWRKKSLAREALRGAQHTFTLEAKQHLNLSSFSVYGSRDLSRGCSCCLLLCREKTRLTWKLDKSGCVISNTSHL